METGLTTQQIIAALCTTPHASAHRAQQETDQRTPGERLRDAYVPIGSQAVVQDPDFFAHLIAWNHHKGEVRDAKAALPMIQLGLGTTRWPQYSENALAHLADLNPKLLCKALTLGPYVRWGGKTWYATLRRLVERYLRDLEADRRDFEATTLQHRASVHRLYTAFRVTAPDWARAMIFAKGEGKFKVVRELPSMSPLELVAAIDRYKLPWLVVRGALGAKVKDPDVLMALIGRMTAGDLATSAKWLVKAGVKDHPQTRAAFEQLIEKAGKPSRARGTTLKTQKAAKVLEDVGEEKLAGKLEALQERQLEQLRTIDGDWGVFGDKSMSMSGSIVLTKRLAAVLARHVKGAVHLGFFDNGVRYIGNVSGWTLAQIEQATAMIQAGGGTAIGASLLYLGERQIVVQGLALVSDGGERGVPTFPSVYRAYGQALGVSPTVYHYEVDGQDPNWLVPLCRQAGVGIEHFPLRGQTLDDTALINLALTMRVGRYSLTDEILGFKLRTLDEVLRRTQGQAVLAAVPSHA